LNIVQYIIDKTFHIACHHATSPWNEQDR